MWLHWHMHTVVAPVSLLNTPNFGEGLQRWTERHRNRKATHQRRDTVPPRNLPGSSTARDSLPPVEDLKSRLQLDVGNVTGSIQISAELDSPTVYPGPASKVTTTLYA
jgi:hypothetical protein